MEASEQGVASGSASDSLYVPKTPQPGTPGMEETGHVGAPDEWESFQPSNPAETGEDVFIPEPEPVLQPIPLPQQRAEVIYDAPGIAKLVDELASLPEPELYIDAEGENLSKDGPLYLLQLFIKGDERQQYRRESCVYIIHVAILGHAAFDTPGIAQPKLTLKDILKNGDIPKMLWDCRMDSEALYHQYNISLEGVLDLQLLEVISRGHGLCKWQISGYERSIDDALRLSCREKEAMSMAKSYSDLFIPDKGKGGNWNRLKDRPLQQQIIDYCAVDVKYMSQLLYMYSHALERGSTPKTWGRHGLFMARRYFQVTDEAPVEVVRETANRIKRSHGKESLREELTDKQKNLMTEEQIDEWEEAYRQKMTKSPFGDKPIIFCRYTHHLHTKFLPGCEPEPIITASSNSQSQASAETAAASSSVNTPTVPSNSHTQATTTNGSSAQIEFSVDDYEQAMRGRR
ncbi:hypothetical protein MMC25_000369 [Agyrium rufum]|nr:hypothetical protein [Agyrium rufum]